MPESPSPWEYRAARSPHAVRLYRGNSWRRRRGAGSDRDVLSAGMREGSASDPREPGVRASIERAPGPGTRLPGIAASGDSAVRHAAVDDAENAAGCGEERRTRDLPGKVVSDGESDNESGQQQQ